jgi:LysM repeat protein
MRSGKSLVLFFMLALLAFGQGCSSSQPAADDGFIDQGGGAESGADAVGSIPEDMLANDEAAAEGSATDGAAASGESTDTSTAEATAVDPFADLNEAEAAKEAASDEEGASGTTGATETYTVKSGDTLMKIAFTIYGDIERWKDLRDWNSGKVKSNSQLKVGTKLTYETPLHPFSVSELGHSYLIKQGDTLAGIADEVYGRKMKYKKLQNYNKSLIRNPNRIFAGFTIFYDITDKEMAEAEARRQERMAGGESPAPGSGGDDLNLIPSALTPPENTAPSPAPVALAPPPGGAVAPPPPSSAQPIAPPSSQPIAPPAPASAH